MIILKKLISWLLELFRKKPQKQKELEDKVQHIKDNLEEIDEKKLSDSDIIDILDK